MSNFLFVQVTAEEKQLELKQQFLPFRIITENSAFFEGEGGGGGFAVSDPRVYFEQHWKMSASIYGSYKRHHQIIKAKCLRAWKDWTDTCVLGREEEG